MIQIQLKIEEIQREIILWNSSFNSGISDTIDSKAIFIDSRKDRNPCLYFYELKPNESRETIVQALENYQKCLLPIGYTMLNHWEKGFAYFNIIEHKTGKKIANFYDGKTRVITINKFGED